MPAMTLNLARGWLALLALGAFAVALVDPTPVLAAGPGGSAPEPIYLFGIPVV